MHTRVLMSSSAIFMAIMGIGASFLPQEILATIGTPVERLPVVLLQVTGALYLGFAFLNWMARGVLIGGIYSRPLALGNFMHFAVVTVVLIKSLLAEFLPPLAIGTTAYAVLAAWFGMVLFTHPLATGKS